jgi:hypothetical protein
VYLITQAVATPAAQPTQDTLKGDFFSYCTSASSTNPHANFTSPQRAALLAETKPRQRITTKQTQRTMYHHNHHHHHHAHTIQTHGAAQANVDHYNAFADN